jgi:hypothetical protein
MASESETTAHSTVTTATLDDGATHDSKRELLANGAATTTPGVGQGGEEEMIGPGPAPAKQRQKRPLQFEQAFLDALPSAVMCVFFSNSPLTFWVQDLRASGSSCECWVLQVREELYAPGRRHPRRRVTC